MSETNNVSPIFTDRSTKHNVTMRKLLPMSLDYDNVSRIDLSKQNNMRSQIDKSSIAFSVVIISYDVSGSEILNNVISNSKDIECKSDYLFEAWIPAEYFHEPCRIEVTWEWLNLDSIPKQFSFTLYYEANTRMETYFELTNSAQVLVNSVMNQFWGLHDNHYGQGLVNLTEEIQTQFSLDRVADAMELACSTINSRCMPMTDYGVMKDDNPFPEQFYAYLLNETIIRLIDTFVFGYLEQPDIVGQTNIAIADRSKYFDRWRTVKQDKQKDDADLQAAFQRAHFNLTGSSILVGGGVYSSSAGALMTNGMSASIRRGWISNGFVRIPPMQFNPNS